MLLPALGEDRVPYQVRKKEPDACAFGLKRAVAAATLVLALITHVSSVTYASPTAASPISVNDSHSTIDGIERNYSVFVPVLGFFEKLGAKVSNTGSSFIATRHGTEPARMTLGSRRATVNWSEPMLPIAAFVSGGAAMLPLRVISEAAGASVAYAAPPRGLDVTRSAAGAGAVPSGGGVAAAAPATVAQAVAPAAGPAATDVASAAPVTGTQTNRRGVPWWLWALLALLVLALIFWAIARGKKDPIITTSGEVRGNDPTINTRK